MNDQPSVNGRKEQGRFEGEVLARLGGIDKNITSLWDKTNEMNKAVGKIKVDVGYSKGAVAAISVAVSAIVALATTWMKSK